MRAGGARLRHEARRRIDAAARADRDEQVAGNQRLVDAVHLARHLAEPHHVGPQGARLAASRADRLGGQVLGPGIARQTCGAERAGKLTMHMDQLVRAGRLVQAVDVLSDREDAACVLLLQPRQRLMRGVRPGIAKPPPAEIVEFVHAGRIAGKAFGRCHLFQIELLPQPAFVAERAEPALGRKPGAR